MPGIHCSTTDTPHLSTYNEAVANGDVCNGCCIGRGVITMQHSKLPWASILAWVTDRCGLLLLIKFLREHYCTHCHFIALSVTLK